MSEPETTKPLPTTPAEKSFQTANGRPKPASFMADGRTRVQQAAEATAEAVGNGVQTVAKAAGQVSPRQYLAVLLRILGLFGLFVLYQTIEAAGLREFFSEVVSMRLSRASPLFLGWMANFEETRRLDIANGLAAAFLFFTYLSWDSLIYRIVHRPAGESIAERYLLLVPAVVLMVADTVLFGVGVYANGSFSSPIPAAMLALAYDSMLVLFSFWIIKIERRKS